MTNVERLRKQQEHCKALIERYKRYKRLLTNDDFIKLFLEDYCITHCVNSIQYSTTKFITEEGYKSAVAKAQATSYFKQYLNQVEEEGEQAMKDLEDLEIEILEME